MPGAVRNLLRVCAPLAVIGALVTGAVAQAGLDAAIGRALFRRAWVPAPSSTEANDGLGPLYNARSCIACHGNLDRAPVVIGRAGGIASDRIVLRLSAGDGQPDPIYGHQLQTASVQGATPEGLLLHRRNAIEPAQLHYGPLAPTTRTGARVVPPLRGLGQLEAVPDDVVLALADPEDRDGDGVSGRARRVVDSGGREQIGRFGRKAGEASLESQVELAFALDLGMSTRTHRAPWGDCTAAQRECVAAPHGARGGEPEISPDLVRRVAAYLAGVDAPKSPPVSSASGAKLFAAIGCAACHVPALPSPAGPVRAFTDLLLHDLGPKLGGGATEPGVAPSEWRTAPLWGLSKLLADGAGLLHDARARSLAEAISHHGGEGARARATFFKLAARDRRRLIAYLKTL